MRVKRENSRLRYWDNYWNKQWEKEKKRVDK